jgi:biotin-(acetyl-CoA carboxylase) ligase
MGIPIGAIQRVSAQMCSRAGKPWYSPSGLNLYLSVILRPVVEVQRAALLTLSRFEGVPADIDESGCLLVRLDDGSLVRVFEGAMFPLP